MLVLFTFQYSVQSKFLYTASSPMNWNEDHLFYDPLYMDINPSHLELLIGGASIIYDEMNMNL